jgi:sulfite exporter TauE/SafE
MSTTTEEKINKGIGLFNQSNKSSIFDKRSLGFMLLGIVIIAVGMLFMAGGKSDENTFQPDKVYGKFNIVVAPILITIGLIVEVYAIMRKSS